jgi:CBS domain-containing protein
MKVRDVMTSSVRTVDPGATLKEVAVLIAEHGISGLPVVDADGVLLGVVSKTDILMKESAETGERGGLLGLLRGGDDPLLALKVGARTARDAMTSPALTIEPDRAVAVAAGIMLDARVNRLPVVSDGVLVGIVSRSDLVRAFIRSDTEITREITDEVVQGTFWLPPASIEIAVKDGVVELRGQIETRTDAEMLPKIVRKVAGVVAVESHLTWRVDGPIEFERRGV